MELRPKTRRFFRRIPLLGRLFREATLEERLSGACRIVERKLGFPEYSMKVEIRKTPDKMIGGFWEGRVETELDEQGRFMFQVSDHTTLSREYLLELLVLNLMRFEKTFPEIFLREGILDGIPFPEDDSRTDLLRRACSGEIFLWRIPGKYPFFMTGHVNGKRLETYPEQSVTFALGDAAFKVCREFKVETLEELGLELDCRGM